MTTSSQQNALKISWVGEGFTFSKEGALSLLEEIASEGKKMGFRRTSPVAWNSSDFDIEGSMDDPFGAKLQARRTIFKGSPWDVVPLEAYSVTVITPHEFRPINITLSRYPETTRVRKRGGEIINLQTKISPGFHIKGAASSAFAIRRGKAGLEKTHRELLQFLERVGERLPSIAIMDNTGYSRHCDADKLFKKVKNRLCLDAYNVGQILDQHPDVNKIDLAAKFPVLQLPDFEVYEMEGCALAAKIRLRNETQSDAPQEEEDI